MSLLVSRGCCRYVHACGGLVLDVFGKLSGDWLQGWITGLQKFEKNFGLGRKCFGGVSSYGRYLAQVTTCFRIYKRKWRI